MAYGHEPADLSPLTVPERDWLIRLLTDRQAIQPCPRCKNKYYSIDPHIVRLLSYGGGGSASIALPCIAVICDRCSYVNLHAMAGEIEEIVAQRRMQGTHTQA